MSQALEGTPKPGLSLTEQANSQRLCRSTFIGHSIGYALLFAVAGSLIQSILAWLYTGQFLLRAGFGVEVSYDLALMPPLLHLNVLTGNLIVAGVLLALQILVWLDLTIRRRHDRGGSGLDAVLVLALLVASQVAFLLDVPRPLVATLDALFYLGALYLFVVLVLLPGTKGANSYGPPPG